MTRIKSRSVLDYVKYKRDGKCLLGIFEGNCFGGLDPHHIVTRGAGGDDIEENLITLCRKHHSEVHNGLHSKEELREILSTYYHYEYD